MGEIDIDTLRKVFPGAEGEIVAIDDLDITIEDGEFLVLVGPSGCGKSTTLRCIAGLETPSSGTISLDGVDITDRQPKNRNMAMVFQSYALYPHMTARENMSFGLKMTTDLSKGEIDTRVSEAAEMMGIERLLDQKPGEMSGGQQQRVALGRAIVRDPEVFLMDEPLSNLDAKLRTTMRTELQSLQSEFGVTTVYVTHDQTEAMTMGDRIAVLNDGELQQIGTPLECYHEPANQFVAGFIGSPSMNFFETSLSRTGAGARLDHEVFDYLLDQEGTDAVADVSDSVTLGIRPEDIELADGDEPNAFSADVTVTEPLGDVTFVYFEIGGQQVTASIDGDILLSEGSTLDIVFPQNRIHLFDGRTGGALKNREMPTDDELVDVSL
ncbi:ABC transporter ATP-binding protein [Halogeometricum limi]|uniref:ABC-type D-xylose/L-arabinose transporter n=1 Tax=Halogeometricum limi TaxID=555875 RepID=A0A1I6IDH5_9EURY|nr:ABC transporter ATP-binding protein [Halogeometricum limi]SFR64782.1 multiple sugar transport system ATP-binding protein [Halogeometricum limi]